MLNELVIGRALVLAAAQGPQSSHTERHTLPEYAAFDRALNRPSVFERRACARY